MSEPSACALVVEVEKLLKEVVQAFAECLGEPPSFEGD
jgi:hypothetical protein